MNTSTRQADKDSVRDGTPGGILGRTVETHLQNTIEESSHLAALRHISGSFTEPYKFYIRINDRNLKTSELRKKCLRTWVFSRAKPELVNQ